MASVTAKVTVQIEIIADGKWGDDCAMKQIKLQAMNSVNNQLDKAFGIWPMRMIAKPVCYTQIHGGLNVT